MGNTPSPCLCHSPRRPPRTCDPLSLRKTVERVLTLPSDAQLQALAHQFADEPMPDEGPLEAIELQVWATQFDPTTLAPSSTPIRFLTVRIKRTLPSNERREPGSALNASRYPSAADRELGLAAALSRYRHRRCRVAWSTPSRPLWIALTILAALRVIFNWPMADNHAYYCAIGAWRLSWLCSLTTLGRAWHSMAASSLA